MSRIAIGRILTGAASLALAIPAMADITPIDLTQDPDVRAVATYTYYSRNGSTLTTPFYPGSPHGDAGLPASYKDGSLTDAAFTGGGGAAISLQTGDLTNTGNVAGWRGVVDGDGKFDILIDLGALYTITSVTLDYSDFSGFRWDTGADRQAVYIAASLAGAVPQESDFTLFDTETLTGGSTTASKFATFDGADTNARYILFRGDVSAGGTGSNGGVINEITIHGTPVPEPGAMGLMLGGAALLVSRGRVVATER